MNPEELKLECELLIRKRPGYLTFCFLGFFGFMILLNLSLPDGKSYKGFLYEFGWTEYIPDITVLYAVFLFLSGQIVYLFIISALQIRGMVVISPDYISIERWHKFNYLFKINSIKNFSITFNHFKKNDTEPRGIVDGNNNVLRFTKMGIPFKYEFLLQTIQEDEDLRKIMSIWEERNIPFRYFTTLSDL